MSMQFERRVERAFTASPEQKIYMSTAEDIILAKLEWFRAGGEVSDRQWRDILGVLKVQGERLDYGYLRQWAEAIGVHNLLERAMKESA